MNLRQVTHQFLYTISGVLMLFSGLISIFFLRGAIINSIDHMLEQEKIPIIENFIENPSQDIYYYSSQVQIVKSDSSQIRKDEISTIYTDSLNEKKKQARVLKSYFTHNHTVYYLQLSHPFTDYLHRITLYYLLFLSILYLIVTLVIIYYGNHIHKKVWAPFYSLLVQLKNFEVVSENLPKIKNTKIAEFNELYDAVYRMAQRAKDAFNSQKQFMESSSHELKTPLTIMLQNLDELIQSEKLSSYEMVRIQALYESVRRLNQTGKSLTLLYKIENQHFLENETIHIQPLIERMVENMHFLAEEKNITTHIHMHKPLYYHMNKALAEVLISNLLSNAYKYGHQNGYLQIHIYSKQLIFLNTPQQNNNNEKPADSNLSGSNSLYGKNYSQGLGITIIKRICQKYGIDYKAEKSDIFYKTELYF